MFGATGMLGRAVVQAAPPSWQVSPSTRDDLDITDAAAVLARMRADAPDWVINCAAYTRVDAAEIDPEAWRVNAEAPGVIGTAAVHVAASVVHVSTDYVFNGTLGHPYREDDAPNPLGAYGRSKLAGELALRSSGAKSLILRAQWLYGDGGLSFVATMRDRAANGLASRVVSDQLGAPTHTDALAEMIWRLVLADARGVVHGAASGEASWFDVARDVYSVVGASESLVTPCTTAEYGALAPRPLDGRLDCSRYRSLTGQAPEDWRAALRRYLG